MQMNDHRSFWNASLGSCKWGALTVSRTPWAHALHCTSWTTIASISSLSQFKSDARYNTWRTHNFKKLGLGFSKHGHPPHVEGEGHARWRLESVWNSMIFQQMVSKSCIFGLEVWYTKSVMCSSLFYEDDKIDFPWDFEFAFPQNIAFIDRHQLFLMTLVEAKWPLDRSCRTSQRTRCGIAQPFTVF